MKPHKPIPLPPQNLDWEALIAKIGVANRFLARYDGLLQSIVNPGVLLSPIQTQEAVLSSKIEGTQATLEEVMEFDASAEAPEQRKGDIEEVINYRIALITGRRKMEQRPLSLNVIKQMHALLLKGVRGDGKDPGNFRRIQNWIGPPGSSMDNARFVPPSVPDMEEGLYDWEKYLHTDDKDIMVQLAIVHAQFEILHPFIDGNGRIGRILIPLFLFHKGIIHEPVFYMSQYLENRRQDYYDALKSITDTNNWTHWVAFFLDGIINQAERNIEQTKGILFLYDEMKTKIAEITHSQWAIQCSDYIFSRPIFNTSDFQSQSDVPKTSTARLLKTLEEHEIISCINRGAGRRPSVYAFRQLINIINS